MKRTLIAFALLTLGRGAWATVIACEDQFTFANVRLSYCSNHCYRSDMEVLYHRGLAEALDVYLGGLREKGTLDARRLEIIIDPIGIGPATGLTRTDDAYQVYFARGAVIDLRQLMRIVDYFGSERWRPYEYDVYQVAPTTALRRLNRILDREVGQPDMSRFATWRTVVAEAGALLVVYEGDEVFFELAGERLDLIPADPMPVEVGKRHLFGSEGMLHVYEEGAEILRRPWRHEVTLGPLRARAQRSWADIGHADGLRLRYAYDKNRFEEVVPGPLKQDAPFAECGLVYTAPDAK